MKPKIKPKAETKPGLKLRVLTAVIGIPVIILILFAPPAVMLGVVILCSAVGLYEFYGAVGLRDKRLLTAVCFIGAALIPCCVYLSPRYIMLGAFIYLMILFVMMLFSQKKILFTDISLAVMSLVYIPFLMSHILFIRRMEFGNIIVWLVFLGAFMTDSCAFFAGKTLGRHKLCPNISPKKTIEGAVGGTVGCGLAFLLFAVIVNACLSPWLSGNVMSYGKMFMLGLICAVTAQIGDLTASLIKRQFGIKDFGNLFPGHGGMLDRCDSIVLVAPTVYLFALLFGLFI